MQNLLRALPAALLVSIVGSMHATPARAVDHCRARATRDGTIVVRGRHVTGALTWGDRLGDESSDFFNAATCISGTTARRCTLGAPGSPESVTPPPACTVFLKDAGTQRCAAYVPKCLPTSEPTTCAVFPADNVWNAVISGLPAHAMSDTWIASVGAGAPLHPDFGAGLYGGGMIGIPYAIAPALQPLVPISFYYSDESDPGPYPIPPFAPIEGGRRPGQGRGDRHVLVIDEGDCTLFEVFDAHRVGGGASWSAGSGATWSLTSNALRADGATSADAAGLPILPGLVRYDEVHGGSIQHALRFTAPVTQRAYVWPARHFASSSTDPALPPMGIRVRLKASVDISTYPTADQVILAALKTYGMFLADNGSPFFISGAPDPRWDNDELHALTQLHGSDFEVVDESSLMVDPDSGQAAP